MRCTIDDKEKVNRILSDDSIYIPINGVPCPEKLKNILADDLLRETKAYVLSPNDFSVLIFLAYDENLYTGHTSVLPEGRGRQAIRDGKLACQWMFENTKCIKIFGFTPEHMLHVRRFNILVGFKEEGVLSNSHMHNGSVENMIIFGLNK